MSYFRENIDRMAGYVPGEQPQAGKFIKLNTNENPYPASPVTRQAVAAAVESGLSRYPDPMAEAFRRRAADLHQVDPDWILCGNGSDDLLTVVTRALVGEGGLIRAPYPSYILYRHLADIQGARFEEIPFRDDWTVDDAFAEPHEDLRLVFLPNPNSPSGTFLPPEHIADLATRLSCPLVVDEAYVDFADDNCIPLVTRHENVLVTRSLSKSYALAGLRFGYVIARPQLISGLAKVKDSYNCDSLSIAVATAAIDDQGWLVENRRRIIATRARMTEALRELGFVVPDSDANFVWCTHSSASARSLYEGLKDRQILVRYMPFDGWGEGLRITVGTDDQVDACLSILATLLDAR